MARLSAHERLQLEMYREYLATQRSLARSATTRDVLASWAQASGASPINGQIASVVLGATMATLGGALGRAQRHVYEAAHRHAQDAGDNVAPEVRSWLREGTTLGQHPFETAGEALMLLGGARATAGSIADIIGAFVPDSLSMNQAYDLGSRGAVHGGMVAPPPLVRAPTRGRPRGR